MITASVVLYNTPKGQFRRLLDCIKESSILPHLYVVDNSPVASLKVEDLPDITYIKAEKNGGYGAGHNIALRKILAVSDFHFVLNPDIRFGRTELEKMLSFMREHEEIGQLMPKVVSVDGSLQYLCKLIPDPTDLVLRRFLGFPFGHLLQERMERFELRFTGYSRVMDVPYLSGCFMLFRVSALREIGLFDERFFMYPEDIDITRRMNAKFRTVFFPDATVVHDHARDSYKSATSLLVHMMNIVKYFNKWGWVHDPERTQVNRKVLRELRS
jgi:GT2 family glycosyltransferase